MNAKANQDPFLIEGAIEAARLLKAIGNEHRLLVLCLLLKHDEIAVGELQQLVPLSQSALSQHLAKMRNEGLLTYRREAQTLFYRIDNPNVAKVIATLREIYALK
ncbi:metalloregulator ArsR/SmtB family transcription factor [Serratia bockelmannii]|uniref:ArsR/SmtB family transcription factor n=1 Tax=Serratia bockelmannii TaxID=2703793 RepID=UPI00223F2ED7|nr:metalloregulator ArsR/SmtB family transcription factor [Serratia bockelmannii]MCW7647498.1 metalloregulator ArsR/SmtB family transcription factor [Serratia bockelmannii]MCW7657283.1 metalloregulator ArsR/SmtB family transcription factor [Serratia bockelmannii]MCW7677068.1 metalloregulator ArsR/SmtB family transcription factor [Serratia bockelmannii]MCW7681845.1 metalloregulator ArsR/SmtB family transcription factor [Serratia bockelmannii]MCW7686621.1 metalloregulator ArsR/SmtB family transc